MKKNFFIPKEKLKKARTERGLKQTEFAEMVAMDQSQYSRRESGKVPISNAEWDRFARELGVSKDDIYESELKNNMDYKDNSINAFEITIKAPNNFFQDLNNKLTRSAL